VGEEHARRCALDHDEPPTHQFQATLGGRAETGFLCRPYGDAAVGHDRIGFEAAGGSREKLDELGPMLTNIRTEVRGQRLPDSNREIDGSLVTDRHEQGMACLREERLAREWESTIEPDPWNLL
jgi:hypothetical protein